MKKKIKCVNCISDMQPGGRFCTVCGFDNFNTRQGRCALPCNYLLDERYIIGRVIGGGGSVDMYNMYIAWDKSLNRKVIVREFSSIYMPVFIQSDRIQKEYDNILKEARTIAKIGGTSAIVRVLDCFLLNGGVYLVKDFVEGITLWDLILRRGKRLTFEQCVCLFRPIMEELIKVHSQQTVHGNITSYNIIVQRDGALMLWTLGSEDAMCNVLEDIVFGEKTHKFYGYLVLIKRNDPRLDVFGLCATIYMCITGKSISDFRDQRDEKGDLYFPPEAEGSISDEEKQILRDGLTENLNKCIRSVDELLRRIDLLEAKTAAKSGNKREKYKKICINCMNVMRQGENVCGVCGFHMGMQQPVYALLHKFLLHGRYEIDRFLGHDEFGMKYSAWDRLLNIKALVKEYFPNGEAARDVRKSTSLRWYSASSESVQGCDNFLKEARKMAKMDQPPSVVRVRDIFFENKTAYIVSDFVEGITLKKLLLVNGTLTFEMCIQLLRPIIEELAKVHSRNIVHSAVNPDNIMVQTDGRAVLLNLGIAKDIMDIKERKSRLAAKKGFAPLEEYMEVKKIGPWTDVYGMCATIYYCITGKVLPLALDRLKDEILHFPRKMRGKEFYPEIQILKDGLAVKPEERIRNMEELLQRLEKREAQKKKEIQDMKKVIDSLADTVDMEDMSKIETVEIDRAEIGIVFDFF